MCEVRSVCGGGMGCVCRGGCVRACEGVHECGGGVMCGCVCD